MATKEEKKKKNPFKRAYNRTNLLINPVARTKAMSKGIKSGAKKVYQKAKDVREKGVKKRNKILSSATKKAKELYSAGVETRNNTLKRAVEGKYNPWSEKNKKIQKKQKTIKSKDSTSQEKSKAKSQKSALIRKRDNIKIKDVHAKQKSDMQDRARARHKAWKEEREKKRKARKNRK